MGLVWGWWWNSVFWLCVLAARRLLLVVCNSNITKANYKFANLCVKTLGEKMKKTPLTKTKKIWDNDGFG